MRSSPPRGIRQAGGDRQRCLGGAGAVILPGVRIGSQALIGAGSVVTHDIPERASLPAILVG
jgi:serine acetyltransferase